MVSVWVAKEKQRGRHRKSWSKQAYPAGNDESKGMHQEEITHVILRRPKPRFLRRKNAVNRLQYQSFAVLALSESEYAGSHHGHQQDT